MSFRGSGRRGKMWLDQKYMDVNVAQARLLEPSPRQRQEAMAALTGSSGSSCSATPCCPSSPSTRWWEGSPASPGTNSSSSPCSISTASTPTCSKSRCSFRWRPSPCTRLNSEEYDFVYHLPELQEAQHDSDRVSDRLPPLRTSSGSLGRTT